MRRPIALLALLLALAAALLPLAAAARPRHSRQRELSETDPPVNVTHIFQGEINKKGRPVGFHSRPGGRNPPDARVVRVVDGPNRQGVYVAEVEIRNGEGRWLTKTSTFYPDRMSRREVIAAILEAFEHRTSGRSEKFRGPSGRGFTIEGYFQNGRINTAWPIYQ